MKPMASIRISAFAASMLASLTMCRAQTLWTIYWLSAPFPCGSFANIPASLGGPISSPYYPVCVVNGTTVSICPSTFAGQNNPWAQGSGITVIGYDVTCAVSSPTSQCIAEIGSGHNGDGADVFARTAGVGSNNKAGSFPKGIGVPQGNGAYSHFDIYAACDGTSAVTGQVLVDINYTSP